MKGVTRQGGVLTPIMMSTGLLPAEGTLSKIGPKNSARRKQHPQTTVLKPVFAPALMDAEDSGETKMGAELRKPLNMVSIPHITNNHRPAPRHAKKGEKWMRSVKE
jgi:hypothetical protein